MKIHHVTEAPIEDFQTVGDFNKSSSFRKEPDRRLLTNPRYVERIKNMFAATQLDFRMWFVNNPEAGKQMTSQGVGAVTVEWMEDNMPDTLFAIDNHDTIQAGRSFGNQAINVVFTSNYPYSKSAGYRPMTGWMIAHRMAHVLLNPNFRQWGQNRTDAIALIDREVWDKFKYIFDMYGITLQAEHGSSIQYTMARNPMFLRFLSAIGTMRSARDAKLLSWYEFMYECFAQFLLKGAVTFNPAPPQLIRSYSYGRPSMSYTLRGPEQSEANYALQYIEDVMQQEFERALHAAVGKIFVM